MRSAPRLLAVMVCVLASSPAFAAEPPEFNAKILPLFRKYCNGCHNTRDAEGGLVLQDYVRTMKGGEEGPAVIAGNIEQSHLWQRLVAKDDTRMPPKNQPAPKQEELALIKLWIEAGAKAPADGSSATGLITPKISPQVHLPEAVTSIAASPDGRWVALARSHSVEILSNQSTGSQAQTTRLAGHTGRINEVSFSRNGQWLCVAAGEIGLSGEATLWRTADWSRGPVLQGHRDALYSAQISPDGKSVATASYDREVILWDIATSKPINVFRGHNDAIYGLSFSANGKLLATASGDRTVKLWDVATAQRLDTFSQPAKDQTTVAFSPDGQTVAAGGVDNRIRVWGLSETAREGTNPILFARFAHEGPILKLAYSPNGKLLASSSEDRRIKLWETKTYTQVALLERQSDWASALAFTPDSQKLIVGRMNGEHHFYPIDPRWLDAKNDRSQLDEAVQSSANDKLATLATISDVEPNDTPANATTMPVPGVVKGELKSTSGADDVDYFRIEAAAGEQLVIETNASRSGSLADTKLDVLTSDGQPVLRGLFQAVRDSWINFRPIDSSSPDVRLEFWEEMDLNQYVYLNGEICRIFRAPQGPDSGFVLYNFEGKRRNYFDTSAAGHAKDEPAYIVEGFTPDSRIVDNGLPVFPLYYSNDDDADRKWGKDSKLMFTAPQTGVYLVKVSDVRGFSGDKFQYTLTVRRPAPDFNVTVKTMNPAIPIGSGQRVKFAVDRQDHFDGDIRLDIAGLPAHFAAASPVFIKSGMLETFSVLTTSSDATEPTQADWDRVTVLATAEIDGRLVTKTVGGLGQFKLDKPAPVRVRLVPDDPQFTTLDQDLVIEPGTTITAKIIVERNTHQDDVKFEVDNLPHGIIVDNIGLSGVLVRKGETERQIFLTARTWVPETEVLIHAVAQGVGNQASSPIRLLVRQNRSIVSK